MKLKSWKLNKYNNNKIKYVMKNKSVQNYIFEKNKLKNF